MVDMPASTAFRSGCTLLTLTGLGLLREQPFAHPTTLRGTHYSLQHSRRDEHFEVCLPNCETNMD
jgi:hypothetical protein